ncbi:MAG: peptidylprolyl isomerase [Planctomycetes bacterium]|nr:peptidylprolyl isomerase [Planctomycetota bacterium]
MSTSGRVVLCSLLVGLVAGVPAQGRKSSRGKGKEDVVERPVDDAVTKKDKAIVAVDKFIKKKVSTKRQDWKSAMAAPPELKFADDRDYFWHVETDKGLLKIRLFPDSAPRHVASTVYLSRAGFYDGLVFPRVLKNFMAQGGSPTNTTAGNAGYNLDHEFDDKRKHVGPGTLSAANSGAPNTDGSQFFLTFVPCEHLDGKHTVYGQVVDLEASTPVLKAIEACGVASDAEKMATPPKIVRTWITVAEREVVKEAEKKDGKDADS